MNEPRDLIVLQRWMQAVISHPLGIVAGIESDLARSEIDVAPADIAIIIPASRAVGSVDRLAIYGNAYFARLIECMRSIFPVLTHAFSEEVFDSFAFGYLQQYPSQSYTLDRLADSFIPYLEETRPAIHELIGDDDSSDDGDSSWPDFLIDLAHLEWTIHKVFDGPGSERETPLTMEELTSIPPEQWGEARLTPAPCLRLLSFRYPVNDFYTAVRREQDPPFPDAEASYAAISRQDYVVRRFDLSEGQFQLLSALVAGNSLGASIAAAAEAMGDDDAFAASLRNWFSMWSANGFFQRVEFSTPA